MLERVRTLFGWEPKTPQEDMSDTIMLVGLGNPGAKYEATRHNVGFMLLDLLSERHSIPISKSQKKALTGSGRIAGQRVLLVKPLTYMNKSGDSAGPLADYYQIDPERVLVMYDELDVDFGRFRLRAKGGAGGHNGMKSLIYHLGNDFPRLRIGIGRPPGRMAPADFVLRPFSAEERTELAIVLQEAADAVETFLTDGVELAMTRHNKRM